MYVCASGRFCVLDDCSGMRVMVVDASLGIMGFMGTVRIMGNVWASLDGSRGLPGRCRNGGGSAELGWIAR